MSSIGKKPVGSMPLDTLLGGMKAILEKELQPLRQRIASLEVENRSLRARLNSPARPLPPSGRFQPLRRT